MPNVSNPPGLTDSGDVDHDETSNRTHDGDDLSPETLEVDRLNGADVLNASGNQILVTQGDGTLSVEAQAQGPNPYDQAQSFTEQDITSTFTNTVVDGGSISLQNAGTTANNDDPDDNFGSATGTGGLVVNPNASLNGIRGKISTLAGGFSTAYLERLSDNTVLQTKDISSKSGGDDFQLLASLSAGTDYGVYIDNNGNQYTRAFNTGPNFPYTSADIDITAGFNSGNTTSTVYNLTQVTALPLYSNGTVTIEWDSGVPTDIFEWDVATYTRTLDNETVDVFVAYSSDGGSTWTRTNSGNPITRNYSLNEDANITPSVDVRIEAELSRADTANNPTLNSCYRSWFV